MEATNQASKANDYAVANALNKLVYQILVMVYLGTSTELYREREIAEINSAYILLTHELDKIYSRNPELLAIKPEPIWRRFELLKHHTEAIADHFSDDDNSHGTDHNIRVEKLCIIAGVEEPKYNPDQQKLADNSDVAIKNYTALVKKYGEELLAEKKNTEYGWEIFEYNLEYKQDGTILVNNVLKLKKVHAGSITEKLLEQAIKNPNKKFKPNLGKTARNLSTIISSAGFTPVLRDLFFPTVSGDTVVFRPYVSKLQADLERIDRDELDLQLYESGALARVVPKPN